MVTMNTYCQPTSGLWASHGGDLNLNYNFPMLNGYAPPTQTPLNGSSSSIKDVHQVFNCDEEGTNTMTWGKCQDIWQANFGSANNGSGLQSSDPVLSYGNPRFVPRRSRLKSRHQDGLRFMRTAQLAVKCTQSPGKARCHMFALPKTKVRTVTTATISSSQLLDRIKPLRYLRNRYTLSLNSRNAKPPT